MGFQNTDIFPCKFPQRLRRNSITMSRLKDKAAQSDRRITTRETRMQKRNINSEHDVQSSPVHRDTQQTIIIAMQNCLCLQCEFIFINTPQSRIPIPQDKLNGEIPKLINSINTISPPSLHPVPPMDILQEQTKHRNYTE